MKKAYVFWVSALILTALTTSVSAWELIHIAGHTFERNTDTWYCVNGKYIDFNSNGIYTDTLVTEVESGSVNLMPIRAFAESIGAELKSENGIWYVITDEYAIDLFAGDDFINVYKMDNANPTFLSTWKLSCPVVEHEGVTYIPFRSAICALFGVAESETAATDKIAVNQIDGGYAIFANEAGNAAADKKDKSELTRKIQITYADGSVKPIDVSVNTDKTNFKKYLNLNLGDEFYCKADDKIRKFNDSVIDQMTAAAHSDAVVRVNFDGGARQMIKSELTEKYYYGKTVKAMENPMLAGNMCYDRSFDDEDYIVQSSEEIMVNLTIDGEQYVFAGYISDGVKTAQVRFWGGDSLSFQDGEEVFPYKFIINRAEYEARSNADGKLFAIRGDYDFSSPVTLGDLPDRTVYIEEFRAEDEDENEVIIKSVGGKESSDNISESEFIIINEENFLPGEFKIKSSGNNGNTIRIVTDNASYIIKKTKSRFDSERYYFGKEIEEGPFAGNVVYDYTEDDDYTHTISKEMKLGTVICDGVPHKFIGYDSGLVTDDGKPLLLCEVIINGQKIKTPEGTELNTGDE